MIRARNFHTSEREREKEIQRQTERDRERIYYVYQSNFLTFEEFRTPIMFLWAS